MSIQSYQSKDKKRYEVYVNGFDRVGKRIQFRRKGIESIRKAEEVEFELKRNLARLKEAGVSPRLGEWITECLGILKLKYQQSTLYTYEKTLSRWIPEEWKSRDLSHFTARDIHELLFERMPVETTAHTRKWVLKIIKRLFQMAVEQGKVALNPASGIVVQVPESAQKVLTQREAEALLAQARGTQHRFYPIWVLALFTGMRSGELYALQWTDVDLEARIIQVTRSWNSKNGYTTTKNQKSRVVPISDELLPFLKGLRIKKGAEGEDCEFVLPHLTEWTRGEGAKVTRSFCKSLGITSIRFHDLRATFITNLLAQGEPLVRVMAVVGHAEMETTNVYLRKAGIELKGATERLGYRIPSPFGGSVIPITKSVVLPVATS